MFTLLNLSGVLFWANIPVEKSHSHQQCADLRIGAEIADYANYTNTGVPCGNKPKSVGRKVGACNPGPFQLVPVVL
jgi:hypothetical protein